MCRWDSFGSSRCPGRILLLCLLTLFSSSTFASDQPVDALLAFRDQLWEAVQKAVATENIEQAVDLASRALAEYDAVVSRSVDSKSDDLVAWHKITANELFKFGSSLRRLKRFKDAIPFLMHAERVYLVADNKINAAWMLDWQGACHCELNDDDAAVKVYQRCIERFKGLEYVQGLTLTLPNLGKTLYRLKRYDEALMSFQQAEKAYASIANQLDSASMLSWQGECYCELKADESAVKVYQQCVERFKDLKHQQGVAPNSRSLGQVLYRLKRYDEALASFQAAETGYDSIGNQEGVAWMVGAQGNCLNRARRFKEAEVSYRRQIEIFDTAPRAGPAHLYTASSINDLAGFYVEQANYAAAEPLYERALKIRENALGPDHPDIAASLNSLAMLYESQAKHTLAEPLFLRAIQIWEITRGPDHTDTASSLNNLAWVYEKQAKYSAAEPLYQRALKIWEKSRGSEHPDTATGLNNLAMVYERQGNDAAAEPLYQRALKIREKVLSPGHPHVALSLNNLGRLYMSQGNYAAAQPLLQRALEVSENALGSDHPETAISMSNLATSYTNLRNFASAEPLYRRALKVAETVYGPDHPDTATSLSHLAQLYHEQGNDAAAEPLFQRAFKISEKALGLDHPATAACLNNLAWLHVSQANFATAQSFFEQALKIREAALGTDHPDTAASLNNLALFHWQHGNEKAAYPLAARTIDGVREHLERTSVIQSEQQQLIMAGSSRRTLNLWLTVTSQDATASEVWNRSLLWKGLTTSRQSALRLVLGHDPLFAEYQTVAQQLSTVTLAAPMPPSNPGQLTAWKERELELRQRWEIDKKRLEDAYADLEKQLAHKSALFNQAQQRQQITVADIMTSLRYEPRATALVDLVIYYYLGQDAREGREKEANEVRLAAFIARPDRDVQRVEFGAVAPISLAISNWNRTFGQGEAGQAAGQDLRRLLWLPLELKLDGIETVLISPDGLLSKIPWGALPGSKASSYLIEERSIAVIPIPQSLPELLTQPRSHGIPSSLLVAGDIDYGGDAGAPADLLAKREAIGRNTRDGHLLQFTRLDGAQPEMASIERRYRKSQSKGDSTSLDGTDATEAAFREHAGKHEWLHVITHGYFAPETIKTFLNSTETSRQDIGVNRPRSFVHPGLLSGLAFAGANHEHQPNKDDGILTAMEVSSLDLSKVRMVVLSACETGLGEIAGGEGLLGLQRSFQVAGARTCIASLWKVPDAATSRLMQRFYENLWDKKLGKLEALREAQVWMLRDRGNRGLVRTSQTPDEQSLPPYYWAAFVLSGDWR